MASLKRIHIPLRAALTMVWNYVRSKVTEQVKAVAFIIVYLVAFKMMVLQAPPSEAPTIFAGVAMVVLGLALFLEGLLLGLMPLGDRVGVQLPLRCGIGVIMAFGLLLGAGATLAEPSIAALRLAGATVTPWETPLLFRLLETETDLLVGAIGAGVGVAVACGMLRFFYGLRIKTLLYLIVPPLLALSAACAADERMASILNLAWDTGGVTTGPVTVPLILALGIGVSRSTDRGDGSASGFGIVALASLLPVFAVLVLGVLLAPTTPRPTDATTFFSLAHRAQAQEFVGPDSELRALAFQRGDEGARRSFFADDAAWERSLEALALSDRPPDDLGPLTLGDWLKQKASPAERALVAVALAGRSPAASRRHGSGIGAVLRTESTLAVRAIVPLVLLLALVLVLHLRDRPRRTDEVVLGIFFALAGMALLTSGIRIGLAPLGDQVGRPLPQVFRSMTHEEGRIVLDPFRLESVHTAFSRQGTPERFFFLRDPSGSPTAVPFDPDRYDASSGRYEHIVERPPLFGPELTLLGISLVFLFAFGMGFCSTIAEPALSALGVTVEEVTIGTVKRAGVVLAVSLGVGIGFVVGIARILYDIPTVWLLIPSYLALLALTHFSRDDFAGIAWDCGGVTTGPITVPLVIALGLGIGGEVGMADGFGIVAMASVFPILTTLVYGLMVQAGQRQLLHRQEAQA